MPVGGCRTSAPYLSCLASSPRIQPITLNFGATPITSTKTTFSPHSPDNALSFGAACAIQI
jgi:hypothetical protein